MALTMLTVLVSRSATARTDPPGGATALREAGLKLLIFGRDVHAIQIGGGALAPGSGSATALHFRVEPEVRVQAESIAAVGFLENSSSSPVTVPLGPMSGRNPFSLVFAPADSQGPELMADARPSAEPSAQWSLVVPAMTSIQFEAGLDLRRYAYEGSPTVPLTWSFSSPSMPEKDGRIAVQLPPRLRGTIHYFIDRAPVSVEEYKARVGQLVEEGQSYCKKSADGGESGYRARDSAGRRYRVRERTVTAGTTGTWSFIDAEGTSPPDQP